jgi:hypothetical protein
MNKIYFLLLPLLITVTVRAQYVSLSDAELGRLKQLINTEPGVMELFSSFRRSADRALNIAPNPIDTISTEGRLKGDPKKTATSNALQDMYKIYSLAIVYRVSGDKKYLQKATAYLLAWAAVNRSKGDPIDDTNLDDAIAGYDLIKSELAPSDNRQIVTWLTQVADAESNSLARRPNSATAINNWNTHRLKVIGEIAWTINNTEYQSFVVTQLKKQVAKNLYPDGSGIDFQLRDALHYHVYDLEPFLKLSIVLKRATGENYYTYTSETQSSIKKSTEWLVPYLTGEKTHGEFVHSTVRFDSLRAANHEAGYAAGTLFDPLNGLKTLALAAYFDNNYTATYQKVRKTGNPYPDWQLVLNKVMLQQ